MKLSSIQEDIELGNNVKDSGSNKSSNLSTLERSKLIKVVLSLCIGIPAIIIIVTLDILHATDTRLPWQLWSALASCGVSQMMRHNESAVLS